LTSLFPEIGFLFFGIQQRLSSEHDVEQTTNIGKNLLQPSNKIVHIITAPIMPSEVEIAIVTDY
jgi:hypothetical protein